MYIPLYFSLSISLFQPVHISLCHTQFKSLSQSVPFAFYHRFYRFTSLTILASSHPFNSLSLSLSLSQFVISQFVISLSQAIPISLFFCQFIYLSPSTFSYLSYSHPFHISISAYSYLCKSTCLSLSLSLSQLVFISLYVNLFLTLPSYSYLSQSHPFHITLYLNLFVSLALSLSFCIFLYDSLSYRFLFLSAYLSHNQSIDLLSSVKSLDNIIRFINLRIFCQLSD